MITLFINDENQLRKVQMYILENEIKLECKNNYIHVDDSYAVFLFKFMKKNNIDFSCKELNEVMKKLFDEKKFDDIHYLYKKRMLYDYNISNLLKKACRESNTDDVNNILGIGADMDLHHAINVICWRDDDNEDMMRMILDYAKINKYNISKTSLSKATEYASEKGNINLVKLLLEYGASKFNYSAMELAILNNHIDIAEIFTNYDLEVEFDENYFMYSAAQETSIAELLDFYTRHCEDQLTPKILGEAFLTAAKFGSIDSVIALVDTGVNLKKYKKYALIRSKKRPHIHTYLKELD